MKDENKPERVAGRSRVPQAEDKTAAEDKAKPGQDKDKAAEPGNPISPTTGEYVGG